MGKTGTALITGGGGFVGARLAGRLVNDGYAEVSDLTVDGALSSAMAGVNVVFHVASFGM
eukprot:gene27705-25164_t